VVKRILLTAKGRSKRMRCPKCGKEDCVKNGYRRGKQRYRCRGCGCNYTKSEKQGYPLSIKRKAIQYYLEGMGFRQIERVLVVSHVSVIYWVRALAQKIRDIETTKKGLKIPKERIIELDELYTYIKKNGMQFGSGLRLAEIPKKYWGIMLELVS